MQNKAFTHLLGALVFAALAAGLVFAPVSRALADRNSDHAKIVQQFGGEVQNRKLVDYVNRIGRRMADASDMANINYRFTVLDNPMVNAFALPSGDIYVTRGLLALANSEAELAGVIGHEIGHVTDSHSSGRSTRTLGIGILSAVLGIATESKAVADLTQVLGAGYVASYSRDQEYAADKLGIKYLRRAAYDPFAQANFLASLEREADLAKRQAGISGRGDALGGFFASHPNTAERVGRARTQAKKALKRLRRDGVSSPRKGRRDFLAVLDGLIFGDTAAQGYVRGQRFSHPVLRLTFKVPPGFQLHNQAEAVIAAGPNGNSIKFDMVERSDYDSPSEHIRYEWAEKLDLIKLGDTNVNGMETAVGVARIRNNKGSTVMRFVALRGDRGQFYRFQFVDPEGDSTKVMSETVSSFRRLSRKEVEKFKPRRIDIIRVGSNTSQNYFAKKMRVDEMRLELFRVLNALQPGQQLRKGHRVKVVRY